MGHRSFLLGILVLEAILGLVTASLVEDKQALLDFLQNIPHAHSLNWNKDSSVCQLWTGVTCNDDHSRVISLRLPGVGLHGPLPSGTLSRLSALQILSLRRNRLLGPFPSDFSKLENLTALYLQFNSFLGPLPQDFSAWRNLTVIDLSNNNFSGSIPASISNMTQLTALNLANNSLSGEIPNIDIPSLQQLNLANNHLNGTVPQSLERFPNWAFFGNNLSSESAPSPVFPVEPPMSGSPSPQPSKKSTKLSESALLGIILGGCVLGFVLAAIFIILCYSNPEGNNAPSKKSQKKEGSLKKKETSADVENQDKDNKIVFFEGCNYAFDLEDLLRASAEVLGKGAFGTTYKAALEDATTVVVKRLKDVNVAMKEFEQLMKAVGHMRHENIAALRACYCSKDEKLLIYDYYSQGSVSSILHGKGGEKITLLDWGSRVQIAVGTARGLAFIHEQSGGKFIHGNLRASNIFFNNQGFGCISDIGLATLMNPVPHVSARGTGYSAPEVTDTRKASQASDVYSFGVLLLELLTGKSPLHSMSGEGSTHLVRWVQSVVREEWTAEVFDVQLLRYPNIEEEMVEMLRLGLACVARRPEQRPKMPEVVKQLEDIRRGNRPSSEIRSEESTSPAISSVAEIGQPSIVHAQIVASSALQSQGDSSAAQAIVGPPQTDTSASQAQAGPPPAP